MDKNLYRSNLSSQGKITNLETPPHRSDAPIILFYVVSLIGLLTLQGIVLQSLFQALMG